VEEAKA